MTTSTAPRSDVVEALYQALVPFGELVQAQVVEGTLWDEPVHQRVIEVAPEVNGSSELANIGDGRQQRNNDFTVTVRCWWAFGGESQREVRRGVEELAHGVDSYLADYPKLAGLVPGLRSARVASWDGPAVVPADGGQGWQGLCELQVACRMRLT